MFCSTVVVVIYIMFGGVVSQEVKKIMRFNDLLFGAILFVVFIAYFIYKYFFLDKEQWMEYDSHFWHSFGNLMLLQSLLLNRKALTYWRTIHRRWRTNLSPPCRVGAAPLGPISISPFGPPGRPCIFTIELT
jgi:hypothetical protein